MIQISNSNCDQIGRSTLELRTLECRQVFAILRLIVSLWFPTRSDTEDGQRLEISDLGGRRTVLYTRAPISAANLLRRSTTPLFSHISAKSRFSHDAAHLFSFFFSNWQINRTVIDSQIG